MSSVKDNLSPNEVVLHEGKLHWWIYVRGAVILALAFFVFRGLIPSLFYLLIGIGIASLVFAYLQQTSSEFVITNKRVILKTGIISRKFADLPLTRADGLAVSESLFGRILGFGALVVGNASTGQTFSPLQDAMKFRSEVNLAIHGKD